jgi:hypothetical protein
MVTNINCPYCKSQAFTYEDDGTEMFLCFDCQRSLTYEKVKNGYGNSNFKRHTSSNTTISVSHDFSTILARCERLSDLESNHNSLRFVRNRDIPSRFYDDLYFTERLGKLLHGTSYEKDFRDGQPKLIIPFRDEDGKMFAFQARSLDDATPKYITVMLDKNKDKIFGLERWNKDKTTVVCEGPIDSFFIKNSLALAGSDIGSNKYLESNKDIILCLDNEPRNAVIVSKYYKFIKDGFRIVLWPDNIVEKDINDMVQAGHNVEQIISDNNFQGAQAKIKLNSWKRV